VRGVAVNAQLDSPSCQSCMLCDLLLRLFGDAWFLSRADADLASLPSAKATTNASSAKVTHNNYCLE
jgi:hypothetical protein